MHYHGEYYTLIKIAKNWSHWPHIVEPGLKSVILVSDDFRRGTTWSIWILNELPCFFFSLVRHVWLLATPWTAARQASLFFTISWSLVKLMPIESVMPSNHPILCHPLLLSPSVFPSVRVFSSESTLCIRWPKYWRFSLSISPSNAYSELISFRIDWLDLLAVQGTLKSLLQHLSSKSSIPQHSAFFTV